MGSDLMPPPPSITRLVCSTIRWFHLEPFHERHLLDYDWDMCW
jgi:hypothetical protein